MTGAPGGRLVRTAGWLLTPLVVWAASFLGGWVGALVGRAVGGILGGGVWLLAGSVAGGAGGLVGWLRVMSRRRIPAPPAEVLDEPRDGRSSAAGRNDETT